MSMVRSIELHWFCIIKIIVLKPWIWFIWLDCRFVYVHLLRNCIVVFVVLVPITFWGTIRVGLQILSNWCVHTIIYILKSLLLQHIQHRRGHDAWYIGHEAQTLSSSTRLILLLKLTKSFKISDFCFLKVKYAIYIKKQKLLILHAINQATILLGRISTPIMLSCCPC